MSSQFPRVNSDPNLFVPPQPEPANDPFALVPGKLGDFLRNGGPLDSGIQRQMGSKYLLDNMDAQAPGADPFDWEEGDKYKSIDKVPVPKKLQGVFGTDKLEVNGDYGAADKPKDPRLKKDKDGDKTEVEGKGKNEPRTLQDLIDEEKANQKKSSAFG